MKRVVFLLAAVFLAAGAVRAQTWLQFNEEQQQMRLQHFNPAHQKPIDPALPDREFLTKIARDTWNYFDDLRDRETGLLIDNIMVFSTYAKVNSYTSTTNLGLYCMCVTAAVDFGFITSTEAVRRIQLLTETLSKVEHWQGQFYNYYETITLAHSSRFISTVDNGWLAAGLMVARQAFPELSYSIDPLLVQIDFSKLYDPMEKKLHVGYDGNARSLTQHHYGLICTEPRVASLVAIALGHVPEEHWFRLDRTFPKDWDWQRQIPHGTEREYKGNKVFNGYYVYKKWKFVPSWGGSLFEFLMPTLVLDEKTLAPDSFGLNNQRALEIQMDYCLKKKKYPAWGLSPCSIPDNVWGYKEYGVPYLGAKGYGDDGVLTPHVSFLALAVNPKAAIQNLRAFAKREGMYGEYGFYDSVNVFSGVVSPRFLALDQAMSLIALDNYLNGGAIQKRFQSDPAIQPVLPLLSIEKFF